MAANRGVKHTVNIKASGEVSGQSVRERCQMNKGMIREVIRKERSDLKNEARAGGTRHLQLGKLVFTFQQ